MRLNRLGIIETKSPVERGLLKGFRVVANGGMGVPSQGVSRDEFRPSHKECPVILNKKRRDGRRGLTS